jgi:hypothetical protein
MDSQEQHIMRLVIGAFWTFGGAITSGMINGFGTSMSPVVTIFAGMLAFPALMAVIYILGAIGAEMVKISGVVHS